MHTCQPSKNEGEATMDLYTAIEGRRSIRKFKPDPVPKPILEKVMTAGIWAPSGMNRQNWHFMVLTGQHKDALVKIVAESYEHVEPVLHDVFAENPKVIDFTKKFFQTLGGAPVVVFAYYTPNKEKPETSIQTVAAAIQNLLLAAHAEGLGACWMTGPVHVSEKINAHLGILDKVLVAVIPLGYPDQTPPAPKRKPNRIVFEGF